MLEFPQSPIPEICISPAPDQVFEAEPLSPFSSLSPKAAIRDEDGYRPSLLSPPVLAGARARQLSPLRPAESVVSGQGLARERFEALLSASRERNASVGAKKATDLRKELALKQHKSKQVERRALFLSKVRAPPSPSAAELPKTPPESPAVFHYTLPSPGLVSPLALFESISQDLDVTGQGQKQTWVEQVDFRLPKDKKLTAVPPKSLSLLPAPSPIFLRDGSRRKSAPSLDEITARLASAHAHVSAIPSHQPVQTGRRLPAFLKVAPKQEIPPVKITPPTDERSTLPAQTIGVGRLRMPIRARKSEETKPAKMPMSPGEPTSPKLHITTTVIPRMSSPSPDEVNEMNLAVLNSRAKTARDMLSTLKRRTFAPASSHDGQHGYEHDDDMHEARYQQVRQHKRHSAPAELIKRERCGFSHPVLALPGAF